MKSFNVPLFGLCLIVLGVVGFVASAIISFTVYSGMDNGALPALSFLSIMLGVALGFPSMLQDTGGGVSTMRVVVFVIVVLFCTIYFKIGWSISKFEDFKIDKTWIYILGLAFGSKVFQRFGEEPDAGTQQTTTKTQEVKVEEKVENALEGTGKSTTNDISQ
jgi:hypothetical protein